MKVFLSALGAFNAAAVRSNLAYHDDEEIVYSSGGPQRRCARSWVSLPSRRDKRTGRTSCTVRLPIPACSVATRDKADIPRISARSWPIRRRTERPTQPCLFLAYPAHQQPATLHTQEQMRATRKSVGERRIGSNQQMEASRRKREQSTSVSAVNRRVVGSSPT